MSNKRNTSKIKWYEYKLGPMPVPLKPFDLNPITDVIVRKATDEGLRNMRELAFYRMAVDWLGYDRGTIVAAGKLEEGRSLFIWAPKGPAKRLQPNNEKLPLIDQSVEETTIVLPELKGVDPKLRKSLSERIEFAIFFSQLLKEESIVLIKNLQKRPAPNYKKQVSLSTHFHHRISNSFGTKRLQL